MFSKFKQPHQAYLLGVFIGFILGCLIIIIITPYIRFTQPPSIRVGEENVLHYQKGIVINFSNVYITGFQGTGSMKPFIDKGASGIWAHNFKAENITVGDIIHFYNNNLTTNETISHRVIRIGNDTEGWFAVTKGDAVIAEDINKVRRQQILGVLVGIIY